MKKLFTLLSMLFVSIMALGADVVYDFTSKDLPNGWTGNAASGYESGETGRGAQWLADATLTLKGVKNVSKVVITCSSNVENKNSIAVSVGGTTWGTETMKKETNVEKVFTGTTTDGDLTIQITRVDKSVYIKKIVISGDASTGGEGGGNTGGEGGSGSATNPGNLNNLYIYSEPTIVTTTVTSDIFNQSYAFIQNNIKVECTNGTQRPASAEQTAYFGVSAGQSITFTATKPIKGIVINGYIKKGFDFEVTGASEDCRMLSVDAEDEDVENDPVIALLDVDSKSVTLNCLKQLRCYSVEFYFKENPEIETEEEDELDFTFEPEEVTTLNYTSFDDSYYTDYMDYIGLPYIEVGLIQTNEYDIYLGFNVEKDNETIIPVGTYEINDTYDLGTVVASSGGTDEYDTPSYVATNYKYYEEYGEYFYNAAYYLVSGTVKVEKVAQGIKITIDAKTYNGSTVKATYVGSLNDDEENEDAIDMVQSANNKKDGKFIQNGKLVIRKDGKVFNAFGQHIQK